MPDWKKTLLEHVNLLPFMLSTASPQPKLNWGAVLQGLIVAICTALMTSYSVLLRLEAQQASIRADMIKLEASVAALIKTQRDENVNLRERLAKIEAHQEARAGLSGMSGMSEMTRAYGQRQGPR